jgi:hypothetical protein
MSGSRKWFVYTDDAGDNYAINLDESNTEAVNAGSNSYPSTGGPKDSVPRNITPRELFYSNPTRTRTIKCVALTQAIYNTIIAGSGGAIATITDPIGGTGTLGLSRANGERRRVPTPVDTGLDDGDQP